MSILNKPRLQVPTMRTYVECLWLHARMRQNTKDLMCTKIQPCLRLGLAWTTWEYRLYFPSQLKQFNFFRIKRFLYVWVCNLAITCPILTKFGEKYVWPWSRILSDVDLHLTFYLHIRVQKRWRILKIFIIWALTPITWPLGHE